MEDPRTVVNLFERHKIHIDPNRPPMTKAECVQLSQTTGGLKRSLRTIVNAAVVISKFEDRAEKPSDSGILVNASLKCLHQATNWLKATIDELESACRYAKEGK